MTKRIRTIQPTFPKSRSMCRVSRDARLLFIQLWLVADDAGRLVFDHERLLEDLYPEDPDASTFLATWLSELEREKCIERYQVNDLAFIRIVKWRKHQIVDRPTPSAYPPTPREAREPREESPRMQRLRASKANPREDAILDTEEAAPGNPEAITPERVLSDLDLVLRKAIRKEKPSSADARYLELAGRHTALWNARGESGGKKEKPKPKSPPLSEIVP
jgi:hypothetical protein